MRRIMIAASGSGSGKTVLTCAVLKAIKNRGLSPVGYKCGPDYIDPMFQRRVLGIPCRNLDLFLQGEENLKVALEACGDDAFAVLEGAMGYFDGIGGSERGSAWHTAVLTDTPVILTIRPGGSGITLAAQIRGLQMFRKPDQIRGILLNDCKESLYLYLKPILERECGVPVLGYLPHTDAAVFESRHLGLVTAGEIEEFDSRIQALATLLEEHADLDKLLELAVVKSDQNVAAEIPICHETKEQQEKAILPAAEIKSAKERCRMAVARDEAFCFYYEDNFRALQEAGAELVFFSPLKDTVLPEVDALYLGGGYPELYAERLASNAALREQIKVAVEGGMPTLAECGGFLYLQQTLAEQPMCGVFSGHGFSTGRLQRFGYTTLTTAEDSMLFRAGESVPAHEFHYWDTDANGTALHAEKENGKNWDCGYVSKTLYAAFPHLHFGGSMPLAERFVTAGAAYREAHADQKI